jgi:hypothetical protein
MQGRNFKEIPNKNRLIDEINYLMTIYLAPVEQFNELNPYKFVIRLENKN